MINKLKYLFMPRFKLVINQARWAAENNSYHYIKALVEGEATRLLFTDHEIEQAKQRAIRNPEDAR